MMMIERNAINFLSKLEFNVAFESLIGWQSISWCLLCDKTKEGKTIRVSRTYTSKFYFILVGFILQHAGNYELDDYFVLSYFLFDQWKC